MHIVYKHFRYDPLGILRHYQRGKNGDGVPLRDWKPHPRGGKTICCVYEDDALVAIGIADFEPQKAFCYRLGRNISRGRALMALRVSRGEVRRNFPRFSAVMV